MEEYSDRCMVVEGSDSINVGYRQSDQFKDEKERKTEYCGKLSANKERQDGENEFEMAGV